ncbi:Plant self-incompatibility S1 - like 10 [Theobroma cacao]|nr:Plant self-incompatibility S1 - like 10 [Theobroma cacao]
MGVFKGNRALVEVVLFSLLLEAALVAGKRHVHLISLVGAGDSITVHCASGDDDLGVHVLSGDGQEFQWSFRVNIFRTTLFYCDVSWRDIPDFHFDAYDDKRDRYECSNCLWLFAPEGIYRWSDELQTWDFRFPWRPS